MNPFHVEQQPRPRAHHGRSGERRGSPAGARLTRRARLGLLALAALLGAVFATGCGDVVPARGWPAPVLAATNGDEQLVVVQTAPGKLTQLAITPAGVAERWSFPGKDDDQQLKAIYATPILHAGTLIVAAFSGDLLALDAASGRPVAGWGGKLDGAVVSDPVVTRGTQLFIATDHGSVHPVDLTSGTIFPSKLDAGGRVYGQGALLRDVVYYGTLDRHLFALDAASGTRKWEATSGPLLSNIVPAGDELVVGTLDAHIRAYSAADGAERWAFQGEEWFWAAPLVADNTIYAVDLDGRAYALDAATGAEQWRSPTPRGNVRGAPVLAAGSLVFATETAVYGLDPATGNQLWSTSSTAAGKLLASPLVVESAILYVTDSGALVRVRPSAGTIETLYTPK